MNQFYEKDKCLILDAKCNKKCMHGKYTLYKYLEVQLEETTRHYTEYYYCTKIKTQKTCFCDHKRNSIIHNTA